MYKRQPIDDGPTTKTITLKELLERISHGYIPDEYLKRLAATLARIYNKADEMCIRDRGSTFFILN